MFFRIIIILIGVIDESSHHLSFDTHPAQDCHRAITQQFKDRVDKEPCEINEIYKFSPVNVSFLSLASGGMGDCHQRIGALRSWGIRSTNVHISTNVD